MIHCDIQKVNGMTEMKLGVDISCSMNSFCSLGCTIFVWNYSLSFSVRIKQQICMFVWFHVTEFQQVH